MSKKKINIALLILVLGLWGTVIYKSLSQYFFPKELVLNDLTSNTAFNFSHIEKDTFVLDPIQRDPFLNKSDGPVEHKIVVKQAVPVYKVKSMPVVKPKEILVWPSISYFGYIKSKVKTEELILVKIDNKLYKLRKNDHVGNLVIQKIYNDSMEVSFNKVKKMIHVHH